MTSESNTKTIPKTAPPYKIPIFYKFKTKSSTEIDKLSLVFKRADIPTIVIPTTDIKIPKFWFIVIFLFKNNTENNAVIIITPPRSI